MSETINIKKEYGKRIEELWKNPAFQNLEVIQRGYTVTDNIHTDRLLFIGINPSYNQIPISKTEDSYYTLNTDSEQDHPYFQKIQRIADKVDLAWTHLDLLFFRGAQNEINTSILKGQKEAKFLNAQLDITCEILEKSRPRVVLVANTKARAYLGKGAAVDWVEGRFQFEFDNTIGTDRFNVPHSPLHRTPIFFSSMLSGQRALDLGSLERLIWHLKLVTKVTKS